MTLLTVSHDNISITPLLLMETKIFLKPNGFYQGEVRHLLSLPLHNVNMWYSGLRVIHQWCIDYIKNLKCLYTHKKVLQNIQVTLN